MSDIANKVKISESILSDGSKIYDVILIPSNRKTILIPAIDEVSAENIVSCIVANSTVTRL